MADPHSSGIRERQTDCPSGSQTQTCNPDDENNQPAPILHLRLNQPKTGGKVKWTTDTVDNEFMGKKKSKCCCIYEKPKVFGESSSSEEEEGDDGCTPHCKGHKKKCFRKMPDHKHDNDPDHEQDDDHVDSRPGGSGSGQGPPNGMQSI